MINNSNTNFTSTNQFSRSTAKRFLEKKATVVESLQFSQYNQVSLNEIPSIMRDDVTKGSGVIQQLYTNNTIQEIEEAPSSKQLINSMLENMTDDFQKSQVYTDRKKLTVSCNPRIQMKYEDVLESSTMKRYLESQYSARSNSKDMNQFLFTFMVTVVLKSIAKDLKENATDLGISESYAILFTYAIEKAIMMNLIQHKQLLDKEDGQISEHESYKENVEHWISCEISNYISAYQDFDLLTKDEIMNCCQADEQTYNSYLRPFLEKIELFPFEYSNVKPITETSMKRGFRKIIITGILYLYKKNNRSLKERYLSKSLTLKLLICHLHNQIFFHPKIENNLSVENFQEDFNKLTIEQIEQLIPFIFKEFF